MRWLDRLKQLHWILYGACRSASEDNQAWYASMQDQYLRRTAWTRLRLEQIDRLVSPRSGERILDLGCAGGAISHYCASRGARVVGVDRSPLAIEHAEALCAGLDCRFVQTDVAQMAKLDDGSFDKAVAADLVEHLPDELFGPMLVEVRRVLCPGGSLTIYTPNRTHLFERMKAHNILLVQNASHVAVRTQPEIEQALVDAGFDIERSYTIASHFPVWNRLEHRLQSLPVVGPWLAYRICVKARS